jgi:hypothetical protein
MTYKPITYNIKDTSSNRLNGFSLIIAVSKTADSGGALTTDNGTFSFEPIDGLNTYTMSVVY